MQSNKQAGLLSFEFASSNGEINPLTFKNPLRVISAYTIEEILPSFHLVQEAVNQGYYAAGFLSYESAAAFDSAYKVHEGERMPLLWFGIFSEPEEDAVSSNGNYYSLSEWKPDTSIETYRNAIQSIKDAIANGVTYQANYTIRLHSQFQGNDIALFDKMRRAQSSNYCAYVNTGEHSILSASPELFFHLEGDKITTRPMKGTTERGKTSAEDEANANWLFHSEKNRAENVMIVDLLRNDLGMIAKANTVKVDKLFEIETYPTVHQMTSTITAKVRENVQLVDIFKALFPCGSITGAPKISTMEIISDLETSPREVYCGAIGYITPNKEAIFNVPIRTVMIEQESGEATYGVGGGITWDSTSEGEYHEVLAKSSFLEEYRPEFQLLESLLLQDGKYFLIKEHLKRIQDSAKYFRFQCDIETIKKALDDFAVQNNRGKLKVRLLVDKKGKITVEGQTISERIQPVKVSLAEKAIDKNNTFLYHKTTNREIHNQFKRSDVFDVLLWNEDEELTEFINGNVVLEMEGKLWTPPVESGLLAGTFRESLIKKGQIQEMVLKVADLERCDQLWFINSVREWVEVELHLVP